MKLRKAKFGTSYELTDEQIKARHTAFDYNKNGEVSLDELLGSIALKNKWIGTQKPFPPKWILFGSPFKVKSNRGDLY